MEIILFAAEPYWIPTIPIFVIVMVFLFALPGRRGYYRPWLFRPLGVVLALVAAVVLTKVMSASYHSRPDIFESGKPEVNIDDGVSINPRQVRIKNSRQQINIDGNRQAVMISNGSTDERSQDSRGGQRQSRSSEKNTFESMLRNIAMAAESWNRLQLKLAEATAAEQARSKSVQEEFVATLTAEAEEQVAQFVVNKPVVTPEAAPDPTPKTAGRPEWLDRKPGKIGDIYITRASAGPFETRKECELELNKEMRRVADAYFDELREIGVNMPGASPDTNYIRKNIVKEVYEETIHSPTVGPMIQLHARMEFGPQVLAEMNDRWNSHEVKQRLAATGVGASIVMMLLSTVFGYLKIDTVTRGQYRNRLRLAAGAILATLGGGLMVLLNS